MRQVKESGFDVEILDILKHLDVKIQAILSQICEQWSHNLQLQDLLCSIFLLNRPGVAGAVLQTVLWLVRYVDNLFMKFSIAWKVTEM